MNHLIKLNCYLVYIFLLFSFNTIAQETITGNVLNNNKTPIEGASIVIKSQDGNIIAFDYSNSEGFFLFGGVNKNDNKLKLTVNSLGYSEYTVALTENQETYTIVLLEKAFELNEVVLSPDQKISSNSNVTTIKTEYFTDKTEQTVEDVLKKLLGVEVLEDGSIKAHGKFISKLLVEGDDVFANNYQILSKNLDAKSLDAVEIIDAFQDNPVLAKVMDSDLVALNLKLNEDFKNIWFGNTTIGIGTQERLKLSLNLGLLRKKIKFFYFNDYNNLGFKASEQVNGTPTSVNFSSFYQEQRIEPEIKPLYNINKNESTLFKNGESTFNKALINSLGFVKKITPRLELRGTATFALDNQNQDFVAETVFNVDTNPISVKENSSTNHKNKIGSGELELKYTGGNNSYLKNIFVYNIEPENFNNSIIFNDTLINQNLKQNNVSYYNHLNHSIAINKNNVVHNYFHFGKNRIEENTNLRSPILNRIFSFSNDYNINNLSNNNLNVAGLSSNLLSVIGDFKHNLKLQYKSVNVTSTSNFTNETSLDSLQNKLNFKTNALSIASNLSYSFSEKVKLSLGGSINHIKLKNNLEHEQSWIFNPEIRLNLRKLKIGQFSINYKNTYNLPESNYFLNNYTLNSYRSFFRGSNNIELVKNKNFSLFYKWASKLESQSLTLLLKHNISEKNYSTSNRIREDLIYSDYGIFNGSSNFSGDINFTSYFKKLNVSTNIATSQTWSVTPFQINNTINNDLKSHVSSYLISGTTYFKSSLNFSFKAVFNNSKSTFNNIQSKAKWNNIFFNIVYKSDKNYNFSLKNDIYITENKAYYFLNPSLIYQPEDSNFTFNFRTNNVLNEKDFYNVILNEFSIFQSRIRLLPRYFFASVKYRF